MKGLTASDIPRASGKRDTLGQGIVIDVYQALISDRLYRKAYSRNEAIKIIREEPARSLIRK